MDIALRRKEFYDRINSRAERLLEILLIGYYFFGLFLAFFYDTWLVAFAVGLLALSLYFVTKFVFPGKNIHHYTGGLSAGIFMAQFIYQMHGLFEMHFAAFIAIAVLLSFQNWKVFLPVTLFVAIHHASFAYIQYLGVVNDNADYKSIYFTQLDYMPLQTFLFHVFLYVVAVTLNVLHTFYLGRETEEKIENIIKMEKDAQTVENNIELANQMSHGNFAFDVDVEESDELGKSLLQMKESLVESTEREAKDRFITTGMAEIAQIIRDHITNLNELSLEAITHLVTYMKANQGALFITERNDEDETILSLTGCYAYDRKKYMTKEIAIGQGLVGQCYLEKAPIYMTDVPENYVNITSGLGNATPKSILIVPIMSDEEVFGIMEFASFKAFEDFHQDFLMRVGEDLASAIKNVRTNERIHKLLEESQGQTEQMRSQEEEMRQNMEELQATQEEMHRSSTDLKMRLEALEGCGIAFTEFDLNGNVVDANDAFLATMGYNDLNEIRGKHHRIFVNAEYGNSVDYATFWRHINSGDLVEGVFERYTKQGRKVFIKGRYFLIKDASGKAERVMKYCTDVTQYVQTDEGKKSEKSTRLRKTVELVAQAV